MNTMLVYLLMLKPALIAAVLIVGVPIALGVWLYSYVRARMHRKLSVVKKLGHQATATSAGFVP